MRLFLFSSIALASFALPLRAQASMPEIRANGAARQMFVDGRPFLMLGGELHNSSASSADYMKPIWPRLAALHLNTVIGAVSWELLEPEEGKFDFSLVDAQIAAAREHKLRLVLIWFATWKNANSSYAPLWVKTDTKRFPRVVTRYRPEIEESFRAWTPSMPAPVLSPLGAETLAADSRAFRALMRHIKEFDPQHTVVMMQVENETGILSDSRDRSPLAEAAWNKPVPPALIEYLSRNRATLLPETREVWGANGFKTSGAWAEVFGASDHASEVFMAWNVGSYVGKVIEAGKKELALPMYVNAWLGPQPGMDIPGQYPSGGPVARMMDVWRAAAPAADLFAPDIYVKDFKGTCALYARSGNPLFIPEARGVVGDLFWTIGAHAGMGFSPFGIDDLKAGSLLGEAYGVLANMMPLVTKAQAENKIAGVLIDDDAPRVETLGGYKLTLNSSRTPVRLDAGQTPPDSPFGPPPPDPRPFGIVVNTAPDEFLVVGSGLTVSFSSDSGTVELGSIDEGTFDNGRWIPGRRWNGDEQRVLLRAGHIGALKVRIFRVP